MPLVPLALAGALLAAVSFREAVSLPRRGRRQERGARWARRTDLRALLVEHRAAHPGRLALGTVPGVVRPALVVAERAQSVVVVGPTQSGKTTALAVPAILAWEGPVVAASVKSDLLRETRDRRNERGRLWYIDPTGATGVRPSTWSPLTPCAEWDGARRVAADLAETAKADGTTADGEFWYATAAKLLAPLFFAAARDGRSMAEVVRWVDTQEAGEVSLILEQVGVPEALDAARASWCRDERTRSSVYTTAETILAPFADAGDSPRNAFEPPDLLGGSHTLYLCAPAHDQRRLRGYFSALTQQVLAHAFAQATRSGKPLDPPLLVVLDEAAHIAPLPELDGLAATCASHGIQLVTVWQDLAQVRARYGSRAPTVLNNHRAKLFLPGIADPDTLDYASRLIGDEEITVPSLTRDSTGGRSTTSSKGPRRLLPPEDLRCLRRGEAVLVYGTLPPARLHLRPWWATRRARRRGLPGWGRPPRARSATRPRR
jgi:type IV secretion system protein VirD4